MIMKDRPRLKAATTKIQSILFKYERTEEYFEGSEEFASAGGDPDQGPRLLENYRYFMLLTLLCLTIFLLQSDNTEVLQQIVAFSEILRLLP